MNRETTLGELALQAAQAAVRAIHDIQSHGNVPTQNKSGTHDLVTAADRAAEDAVLAAILAARPEDAFLGEETGARNGTSGTRWLVDPLDGTANFVHGRSDYAVSVAAEVDGRIQAGAIIRPADGRWAMADGDTLHHGRGNVSKGLAASEVPTSAVAPTRAPAVGLAESLVSFGLPYPKTQRQNALSLIQGLIPAVRGIRVLGSAACDLLAVALGQADAFIGCGLAEWDTAAGQALVIAAGGTVGRLRTRHFEVLIAGSQSLVTDLSVRVEALPMTQW
jgi:myo-inositol-1(or 4)-monophosphatase